MMQSTCFVVRLNTLNQAVIEDTKSFRIYLVRYYYYFRSHEIGADRLPIVSSR